MYTHVVSGNTDEMERLYDQEFTVLTNNYFKSSEWPDPQSKAVKSLVHDDETFLALYTQIYYHHMFSKLQPTRQDKIDSWKNYSTIFDRFLNETSEIDALPVSWAFDIIGEFVYQYQSSCQASDQDLGESWSSRRVLGYLHALVSKSNIRSCFNDEKMHGNVLFQLGYFSLIGLSRINVLFGDYFTSLELMSLIDVTKKGLYTKAPACHLSLLYHTGFAQLMLQRLPNAIRSFSALLLQVVRNQNYYSGLSQYDQLMKLNDKALGLLTIAIALCPGQYVDDQVHGMIREKYGDKVAKMQKAGVESNVYQEIFTYTCPKFISPTEEASEVTGLQLKLFLDLVVRQYQHVPTLRSYLKLYQSIDLDKLSRFRSSSTEAVRSQIMSYKATCPSDLHFFLDGEMVQVDEQKITTQNRSGEFFITQIGKFITMMEHCRDF